MQCCRRGGWKVYGVVIDSVGMFVFFFFSSRRRHTRSCLVSWARRCVQETGYQRRVHGAMLSMLISAGTNLVLDPIFIFGFGMGVKGAAYATVISMMVLTVWVILHFRSPKAVVRLKTENIVFDRIILLEIVAIGMAPFFMQIANSLVQGLLNTKLIAFGGDLAVGAMGIVNSMATMIVMAIVAINMASQPIISFNYGAKSYQRVKDTMRIAMIAATGIAVFAFVMVETLPGVIVKLFNSSDAGLLDLGKEGLRLGLMALPFVGFQVVAGNFFQSMGKAKIAVILTLLRQVIILIPLIFLLPNYLGLKGIWLSMPISDFCSAIVVVFILINHWKKLSALSETQNQLIHKLIRNQQSTVTPVSLNSLICSGRILLPLKSAYSSTSISINGEISLIELFDRSPMYSAVSTQSTWVICRTIRLMIFRH
eukprot:TRINITY_DN11852_c0_g1_i1.p2 TRINITY_DN11852_c0_g1~~TRINITY_DN11852_c0_g1_i1.p2  ORF type:complete len:425 (-),score=21.81 TRINITY_DN11852_c0_g1_i1:1160-2434(-)